MKRTLDLVLSTLALLALVPVLLVLAMLVRFALGSPVIFRQQRPGLHGKPFWLFKLRTMALHRDLEDGNPTDGERLGPFGRWLRSTSLDELPELWNVMRGDMSLVGPRPLLMEYLPLYSPQQSRRQEVRPGLTGWAQIKGRNAVTWKERLELDVWYVDNRSMRLDLCILWRTVLIVLSRKGVSQQGHATMEKFRGNHET